MNKEYPQEFYINLENNENLQGRISVNLISQKFCYEVDIVFRESKKIFKHVGREYDFEDEKDAVDHGVMYLSKFLSKLR